MAGWATHIAKETTVSFIEAAQKFIEEWGSSHLVNDIARQLRCEEVESLCEMLRVLGATEAAAKWIDAHTPGDDCDDQHCRCDTCC
jgi:hypothetical protein